MFISGLAVTFADTFLLDSLHVLRGCPVFSVSRWLLVFFCCSDAPLAYSTKQYSVGRGTAVFQSQAHKP